MLDLAERGYGGVLGPDAIAYHHVGEELLDAEVVRRRAVKEGESFVAVRLVPFRSSVKQAVLFRRHPIMARLYCVSTSCDGLAHMGLRSRLFLPVAASRGLSRPWSALPHTAHT